MSTWSEFLLTICKSVRVGHFMGDRTGCDSLWQSHPQEGGDLLPQTMETSEIVPVE